MTGALAPMSNAAIGNDLWRVVWKLLHLRILIFVSGFRRAKLRTKNRHDPGCGADLDLPGLYFLSQLDFITLYPFP